MWECSVCISSHMYCCRSSALPPTASSVASTAGSTADLQDEGCTREGRGREGRGRGREEREEREGEGGERGEC